MAGTAHVLVHPLLLKQISAFPYSDQVNVKNVTDCGDGLLLCLVESDKLKDGYQGQMDIYFSMEGELRFKRDCDT